MNSWKSDFPESRRKAYYLMAIHENLTKIPKPRLRQIGWSKAAEMVKVARRDGEAIRLCNLVAQSGGTAEGRIQARGRTPSDGKETEPWELIYFKVYKSQLPVIEQALETAAMMLGSDKSRGYMLEMICADFLAGANAEDGDPDALLVSLNRIFSLLPEAKRQEFLSEMRIGH